MKTAKQICFFTLISFFLFIAVNLAHSEEATRVQGQYYLRGICPQGGYLCGTGYDIGTMTSQPPQENGERNCACWIMFLMNPTGSFPAESTQNIHSFYYRIWWKTDNNTGVFGYDSNGSVSPGMCESIHITPHDPGICHSEYSLCVGEQFLSPEFSHFQGEDIRNFALKLHQDNANPSIISYPEQASYIIINPPDEQTLQSLDSDMDGLSDYSEMYIYYTDPSDPDTDNDGFADYHESLQSNPNAPLYQPESPEFGRHVLHSNSSNSFVPGSSLITISDQNNDGIRDLVTPSHHGNALAIMSPELEPVKLLFSDENLTSLGYSLCEIVNDCSETIAIMAGAPEDADGNGRVYVFSLENESVLVIDAPCISKQFGTAVCQIGDCNGDLVRDLAISAPGVCAGGVYGDVFIFSGHDYTLLKRLRGLTLGDRFGASLEALPSTNGGDGLDSRLLIGAPCDSFHNNQAGAMFLVNTSCGIDHVWLGNQQHSGFGTSICVLDDQDLDGLPDIACSSPHSNSLSVPENDTRSTPYSSQFAPGRIRLFSGAGYEPICSLSLESPGDYLGEQIKCFDDIDGDGFCDILSTSWRHQRRESSVVVISSRNQLLWRYFTQPTQNLNSQRVCVLPDITQDGISEFILSRPCNQLSSQPCSSAILDIITVNQKIPNHQFNSINLESFFHDPSGDALEFSLHCVDPITSTYVYMGTNSNGLTAVSNRFVLFE